MSAPISQTQWYLARDGQQFGPLSDAELAKFIELGHLQPTDLLWREGFPDWRPAMVVFPPARAAGAARPAPPMRPAHAPAQPAASPRTAASRSRSTRAIRRAAPLAKQTEPRRACALRRAGRSRSERGGGLKKVLLIVVCLAVLGAAGWYAFPASRHVSWRRQSPVGAIDRRRERNDRPQGRRRRPRSRASAARRRPSMRGCRRRGCGASSSRSFPTGTPSGSRRPRRWRLRTRTRPKSPSTWRARWSVCAARTPSTRWRPTFPS